MPLALQRLHRLRPGRRILGRQLVLGRLTCGAEFAGQSMLTPRPVQHGGGVEMVPYSTRSEPPSVLALEPTAEVASTRRNSPS
jgi:hypothetical protein